MPIQEYILEICHFLEIDTPKISYDTTHFSNATMVAQCNSKGTTIYIKKPGNTPTPDLFFAIAHELRHIWQIRTDYPAYFSDYRTAGEVSTEEYNLQVAEVDANAFAIIVMADFFGLRPQLGLSTAVMAAINARITQITSEDV